MIALQPPFAKLNSNEKKRKEKKKNSLVFFISNLGRHLSEKWKSNEESLNQRQITQVGYSFPKKFNMGQIAIFTKSPYAFIYSSR